MIPLLLCAALSAGSATAWGQTAEEKTKAKQHYVAGKTAFDSGDYATALTEYNQAYTLLPLPGLLFNIGQCYRNLERAQEAINAFNLYLEKSPKAANRTGVEKLIAELEQVLKEAAPPEPKPVEPKPVETDPGTDAADPLTGTLDTDPDGDKPDDDPVIVAATTPPPPTNPDPPTATPVYKKWWFWTIVGVVVAGGAGAGAYFGTRSGDPAMPNSSLGVLDYSR